MAAESLASIPVDGVRIAYRRVGVGPPLLVLNGFAATSADWDPSFIHGVASSNELILLDHRGIGNSTDDGKPFDITQLADDAAHAMETLGFDRISVLGWSMGGFVAQTLALQHPGRLNKLVLLSTNPGGADADVTSPAVWSQLVDTSGTPREQARRLLFFLFPSDVAELFYRQFGNIVAVARARLFADLVDRQAAAMDAWHRNGVGNRLREISAPVLIATGAQDVVIPPSNALKAPQRNSRCMAGSIPSWWARFHGPISKPARRSHQRLSRTWINLKRAQRVQAFQRLRMGFA